MGSCEEPRGLPPAFLSLHQVLNCSWKQPLSVWLFAFPAYFCQTLWPALCFFRPGGSRQCPRVTHSLSVPLNSRSLSSTGLKHKAKRSINDILADKHLRRDSAHVQVRQGRGWVVAMSRLCGTGPSLNLSCRFLRVWDLSSGAGRLGDRLTTLRPQQAPGVAWLWRYSSFPQK